MRNIETSFSPTLLPHFDTQGRIVVVVDILRASSVICTMFMNGVRQVIPVPTLEEARRMKARGFLVVAERDGQKLDFADFGNSPFYFTPQTIANKTVVYSTTNGTQAINASHEAAHVLIGSFLNFSAVQRFLLSHTADVLFLCAGWRGRFSTEDTMWVGAMCQKLLQTGEFTTICDSTNCAIDIWQTAHPDIPAYLERVAQRHRLRRLGLDDVIDFCFTFDQTDKLPILQNGRLVANNDKT